MNTVLLAQGCDRLRLTRQRCTFAREFELTSAEMQLPEIFFPTLLWKLRNHGTSTPFRGGVVPATR